MDDVEDLELTPALLAFYRSRIHQLQRDQNVAVLDRLKQVELSAKQRTLLERELLEYEDELDHSHQDIQDLRNVSLCRLNNDRHSCGNVEPSLNLSKRTLSCENAMQIQALTL
jgi:hypothetical protein